MSILNSVLHFFRKAFDIDYSPDHRQSNTSQTQNNLESDEKLFYRTKDGRYDIKFWFKNCGRSGWRAYILSNIDYGSRNSSMSTTHRLYDDTLSLYYVCWDCGIRTKNECKTVAALWSDHTINYILTGRGFV